MGVCVSGAMHQRLQRLHAQAVGPLSGAALARHDSLARGNAIMGWREAMVIKYRLVRGDAF